DSLDDAVTQSRQGSRQVHLGIRIQTILDDFWNAPTTAGRPYFADSGDRLLRIADAAAASSPAWTTQRGSLQDRLRSKVNASIAGIRLTAITRPSTLTDRTATPIAVTVRPDVGSEAIPVGLAKVSIESLSSPHSGTGVSLPLRIPPATEAASPALSVALVSTNASSAVAEVNFRGHQFRQPVVGSATAAAVTTAATPTDGPTRVTLRNGVEQRRSICFVLDCSASMNDPAAAEVARSATNASAEAGPTSSPAPAKKIDAARAALYEMLRRLQPTDVEVGLVLYGHRMAVGAGKQGLLLQKRYHKLFPFSPTLQPFEDVELVLSTGRFDTVQLAESRQRLDATVPWGQTPLYLAIHQAISDLSRHNGSVAKDVVVISDGENYQFNPTPEATISIEELVRKARDEKVRVHIVGLGVRSDQSTKAGQQFDAIATGSGGSSSTGIYRAAELLRELEQFSSPSQYSVAVDGQQPQSTKLGQTISLGPITSENTAMRLTIDGHESSLPINHGDHLQLIVDPVSGPPRSQTYTAGFPRFESLIKPNGQVALAKLGIHQPTQLNDTVTFRLSIQGKDGRVAPRPGQVWIELAANTGDPARSAPVYRTSSIRWKANMPCPVGEWSCRRWPSEAKSYSLMTWCGDAIRPQPSHPSVKDGTSSDSVSVVSVSQEPPRLSLGQMVSIPAVDQATGSLPGFPEVGFRVRRDKQALEVLFQYRKLPADTRPTPWNPDDMLMVNRIDAKNGGVTHWYDDQQGISVHSFSLGEGDHDETPLSLQPHGVIRLHVTPISEWKNHASVTRHPIVGQLHPTLATAPATIRNPSQPSSRR
ncbi:MAG: vWA domain-containing protein, partial [Planctomycetota bacterium]